MTHNNQEERSVEVEEIAQYVVDNRYPKNEQEKVSDAELYQYILTSIHHQLQKARQTWLRKIDQSVTSLHDKYMSESDRYAELGMTALAYDFDSRALGLNAIAALIKTELDQDVSKWSQCNDCFDGQHGKCIGRKHGCECKHQSDPLPTQVIE